MSRQSMLWPFSIIAVAILLIMMLLASPINTPQAAPLSQNPSPSPSGCVPANTTVYPLCETQTAQAYQYATQTAQALLNPSNTPQPSNNQGAPTPTPTATPTTTQLATATAQPVASNTPTLISTVVTDTPTSTGTLATFTTEEQLLCEPGVSIWITGEGPAYTSLLLYFNKRAVGGTFSSGSGFYRLRLMPGDERAGSYPLEVRVRGTNEVLRSLVCLVPERTPTPTPTFEP